MTTYEVCVDVATLWTSPAAPRPIDAAAVADRPDMRTWTAALDPAARLGLHGRTLTQLLRSEPVELIGAGPPGWLHVAAVWQPSPHDPRGYPGWVRSAHLARSTGARRTVPTAPDVDVPPLPSDALSLARRYLGLHYLWGGTSPWGFDCSGLVHYCLRLAGLCVPRDACAQRAVATPVRLGDEVPGDLYFFARGGRVDHVGFVSEPAHLVHAPENSEAGSGDGRIEETPLSPARAATLVGAGRFRRT